MGEVSINELKDGRIRISKSKAKELELENNDIVCIVGKRRKVTMVNIEIKKGLKGCEVSKNTAKNLRLGQGDLLKIVKLLEEKNDEEIVERSGDYVLLNYNKKPEIAKEVTLCVIKDVNKDELEDEEIISRFILPYIEDDIIMKKGDV